MGNNISMTPYPYDASTDLQKNITCTNESLNVVYHYNRVKDLSKNPNEDPAMFLQEILYWQCPACNEFNNNANGPCLHCGHIRTIKC